jgi:hypothetical protein
MKEKEPKEKLAALDVFARLIEALAAGRAADSPEIAELVEIAKRARKLTPPPP